MGEGTGVAEGRCGGGDGMWGRGRVWGEGTGVGGGWVRGREAAVTRGEWCSLADSLSSQPKPRPGA